MVSLGAAKVSPFPGGPLIAVVFLGRSRVGARTSSFFYSTIFNSSFLRV